MPYFVRCLIVAMCMQLIYGCATQMPVSQTVSNSLGQSSTVLAVNYKSATYKVNIEIFGKQISGLFFIKQTQPEDYRFVLMSEIGLSLMSFRITADSTQLTDCQEFINKPGFTSLIGQDISNLLVNPRNIKDVKSRKTNHYDQLKFKDDKRKYRIQTDSLHHQTFDIKIKEGMFNKTRYRLKYDSAPLPSQIQISHGLMPMRIKLNRLKIVE